MALNGFSRLAIDRIIPRVLLINRNVACAATRRTLSTNPFGITTLSQQCLQYARGTHRESFLLRSFCSSTRNEVDVSYEQLKKILAAHSAVVIDVREPWELREYGNIPGSMNVPLGNVNLALQLNPEEFKAKYGGKMPVHAEHLVFTCQAGVRSLKALDTAVSLGYSNVQHYAGGWQDWAKCEISQTKD